MIEVNNLTEGNINEALLKKVAGRVLKGEKGKKGDLSIAIVGSKKSQELNKAYRQKDKAANVLSFPAELEGLLGEIVLCPAEIKKDAKKYGMIFERALAWMLIHGVLHVIGYDHESEKDAIRMEQKEDIYLKNL